MATLEQDAKYAIHEACREGKSMQFSQNLPHDLQMISDHITASVVESLLNANPKLVNRRDEDDRLPIHWAVSYNHLPIVQLLIASTKDFDPDVQDGLGWTPLMMASSLKDSDATVDLLLSKGADVNMTNNAGQTALHFCASKSNLDTAKKLVAHKASARTKDKRGQLPLHRAASVGSVPLIRLLLENKSPVNATDMDGMTALHHAIAEGFGDAAMALLKAGAESNKKNVDGLSAIEMAPDGKVKDYILQHAELEGVEVTLPEGKS